MGFAILRLERYHSLGKIATAREHNLRLRETPNADPLGIIDVICDYNPEQWKELVNNTRHRSDAVLGYELVLTYSPGAIQADQLEAWKEKNLQWLADTFGKDNIRVAVLHLDEQTPHLQVLVTPIETKTNKRGKQMTSFNARRWTGDKRALNKLQDAYAAAMKPFGLQRGLTGSKARHNDIQVFYDQVNKTVTDQELEPRVIQEKGLFGGREREETAREYLARTGCKEKAAAYVLEKRRAADRDASLEHWRNEADRLRDIPLGQVLEDLGFEHIAKESGTWGQVFKSPGGKIAVKGEKFYDFHGVSVDARTGKTLGGGAIDLVMHVEGVEFKEAVGILRSTYGADRATGALTRHYADRAATWVQNTKPVAVRPLDAPDPRQLQRVRDYLTRERGISPEAVEYLVQRGDLYANRHGSCVFVHRDPAGQVRGTTVRGTRGSFKQSQGDKKSAWFRYGARLEEASSVVLCESPIDALSYATLKRVPDNTCVLSLGGHTVSQELAAVLKRKRVIVALDNPEQESSLAAQQDGRRALKRIRELLPMVTVEFPQRKDWNEDLTRERDQRAQNERQTRELNRQRPGVVVGPMDRAPGSGAPRP